VKEKAYLFPSVKVHGSQFPKVGFSNVNVEGLGLINEGSTISCHVNHIPLRNLPDRLVQLLDVIRDFRDSLNRAIGPNQLVLQIRIPKVTVCEILEQVRVHNL